MNYLELVNSALQEAGVDMDDLTSVNFDNPIPVKMYSRFKRWINKAWEDIQVDNNEWEFSSGTAVVSIRPKLLVFEGNRASDPPQDSEFVSESGDVTMTVYSTETLSGSWSLGTAEAFLDLTEYDGSNNAIYLENYNETTPSIGTNVFKFKYWGRYNLTTLVTGLEAANYETFYVQDPESGYNQKITFVPWAHWVDTYESYVDQRGCPVFMTETPEGYIDFWPRPDKQYTLTFTYTQSTNTLEAYSDEPEGLDSRYHDAIVWLAVMYYADYDKNQMLWAKANRRYLNYMNAVDRDIGPKVTFGRSEF